MSQFSILAAGAVMALSLALPSVMMPAVTPRAEAKSAYSPGKNSRERRAIMDSLRKYVKSKFGMNVIFVVKHLKVKNGWAYMRTNPTSPDGSTPYEPMAALLKSNGGRWVVADVVTGTDLPSAASRLKRKFRSAPSDIFR